MKFWPVLLVWCTVGAWAAPWQNFTVLEVSADGRFWAVGGHEGEVLWGEVSTGELMGRWTLPGAGPVAGLAFAPADDQLGAVVLDGRWVGVTPSDPQPRALTPAPWNRGLADAPARWTAASALLRGVSASWDGVVAAGRPDGTITISAPDRASVTWAAHAAAVVGLAWVRGGKALLSAGWDGALVLWDPTTGAPLGRL